MIICGCWVTLKSKTYTVCPRSSDPFCEVSYFIKWVTTSWTYSKKVDKDRSNYDRYCRLFVSVQYTCFKAKSPVLRNPIYKPWGQSAYTYCIVIF